MRYLHAAAAVAALVSIGPGRADAAANLTVTVSNIGTGAGRVLMAVCPEDAFLTPACPYFAAEPAAPGAVTLRIAVDPGRYAVQVFHDANDNGDLDRGLFGLPREGYGFSNGAAAAFGPPRFGDAAFTVADSPLELAIPLNYPGISATFPD